MAHILAIVFPIFGLIGLGYLSRRLSLLTAGAAAALSSYVYYFSLPALLYLKVSEVPVTKFFNENVILAYSGGILTVGLMIWGVGRLAGIDGRYLAMFTLNVTFGNVGYMGVPFHTVAFGDQGIQVVALTIVLTNTIAVVLSMTLGLAAKPTSEPAASARPRLFGLVIHRFLRNPILMSIALGIVASLFAIQLPAPIQGLIKLLADTAGPVALFAIGTFLEGTRILSGWREVGLISGMKLLVLPLLTIVWFQWLPVAPVPFAIAILQSAMPVAVTNFIFAQQYDVAVEVTAAAIVVSTVLSVLTLSVLLVLLL